MLLSILVPCYNEKNTIKQVLNELLNEPFDFDIEVIVIDNASTDGSRDIIEQFTDDPRVTLLNNPKNIGKTGSIRRGLEHVNGDYVLIKDADLEYATNEISNIVEHAVKNNYAVVYGSRTLGNQEREKNTFYFGNNFLTNFFNFLYGEKITDLTTCYKLLRSDLYKDIKINSKSFGYCPEVSAKLSKKGISINEIPISYDPRSYLEGKKIKRSEGLYFFYLLLKLKFIE